MTQNVDRRLEEIRKLIDDLVEDKSISREACCDALEDIEDHAVRQWAKQIRSEHDYCIEHD